MGATLIALIDSHLETIVICMVSASVGYAIAYGFLPFFVAFLLARVDLRMAAGCAAEMGEGASACGGTMRAATCSVSPGVRIICSGLLGVLVGWASCAPCTADVHDPVLSGSVFCWLVALSSLVVAVACDVAARMIPLETCWAAGVFGTLFQMGVAGFRAVAAGAAFGLIVATLCFAANRWAIAKGRGKMVGGGDVRCMVALSLASGNAAFMGFGLCFFIAALFAGIGRILGVLHRGDVFPFAPFLCVWGLFGMGTAWA